VGDGRHQNVQLVGGEARGVGAQGLAQGGDLGGAGAHMRAGIGKQAFQEVQLVMFELGKVHFGPVAEAHLLLQPGQAGMGAHQRVDNRLLDLQLHRYGLQRM
jgi:hypothetical protein